MRTVVKDPEAAPKPSDSTEGKKTPETKEKRRFTTAAVQPLPAGVVFESYAKL